MAGRLLLGKAMSARLTLQPSLVRSLTPSGRQVDVRAVPGCAASLHTTSCKHADYRRFGDRQRGDAQRQDPFARPTPRQPWSGSPNDVAARIASAKPLFGRGPGSRMGRTGYGWITIVVAGGVTYYVIHLERVPETGRLRFMDISVAAERQLGDEAFQQTLQQYRDRILPPSDRRVQMVTQVAHRIVMAASHQQNAGAIDGSHMPDGLQHGARHGNSDDDDGSGKQTAWEVFVVHDDTPNAFVLPNGKIFVFTGILPICHDADGLATVLGHEIAHQVARHGAEKVAGSRILLGVGLLVSALVGYDGGITRMLLHFAAELPHSRTVELEADKIGLRLMSAACFDPSKAPTVWERMQAMEKSSGRGDGAGMELLSTHPVSSKRQKNMEDWMQEALQIRQDSDCPSTASVSQFKSLASRPSVMGAFSR